MWRVVCKQQSSKLWRLCRGTLCQLFFNGGGRRQLVGLKLSHYYQHYIPPHNSAIMAFCSVEPSRFYVSQRADGGDYFSLFALAGDGIQFKCGHRPLLFWKSPSLQACKRTMIFTNTFEWTSYLCRRGNSALNFGQTIICQKVRGSPLPLLLSSTSKQYLFPKKKTLFLKAPVYWRPKNHFVACSCNPFYSSTDPGLYSHNVPTLETDSFKGIACDSMQIFYTRLCGSRSILWLTIKENYLWTFPSVLQSYPKNTVHRTWTLTRFVVVLTSFLSVKSWE